MFLINLRRPISGIYFYVGVVVFTVTIALNTSSCGSRRQEVSQVSLSPGPTGSHATNEHALSGSETASGLETLSFEWPFEQPYKGPWRLTGGRIAYSKKTLEEYPFLAGVGIRPGIYSLKSEAETSSTSSPPKTVNTVDITHGGLTSPTTGSVRVLVLKVQYSSTAGNPKWTNAEINRRLFQQESDIPGGSMWDYYFEQSHGALELSGDIYPTDDSYFQIPGTPYQSGGSIVLSFEQASNLLSQADNAGIDFRNYDVDGNGYIDALLILFRKFSGFTHREYVGAISFEWPNPPTPYIKDGIKIFRAAFLDHSSIGDYDFVSMHEFGHILGLPDLYDYGGDVFGRNNPGPDGDESNGNGYWAMMAAGNYAFPPQNLSAVSKYILGWEEPINITQNQIGMVIHPVESGTGNIFRIWRNGEIGPEYFIIENRSTNGHWLFKQPGWYPSDLYISLHNAGFDLRDLPPGLLIWHVDERVFNGEIFSDVLDWGYGCNDHEERKFIDLEENTLTYSFSYGGRSIVDHAQYFGGTYDPWPEQYGNDTYNSFTYETLPSSLPYDGTTPTIAVNNIRFSGQDIIADIIIGLPLLKFSMDRWVYSGTLSLAPTQALNISSLDYLLNGALLMSVTEPPFALEWDISSYEFGTYELDVIGHGIGTSEVAEQKLSLIIDNTSGIFPLMENFETGGTQVAGASLDGSNPFALSAPGFGDTGVAYGLYDEQTGGYPANLDALLTFPLIDLTAVEAPTLVFRQHYNLEDSVDFATVVVSTDDFVSDITVAQTRGGREARFTGLMQAWQKVEVDLSPWSGQKVRVGIRVQTNDSVAGEEPSLPAGWWVDNIVIATNYAESIPIITSVNIEPDSVFGLARGIAEIPLVVEAENSPASILYSFQLSNGSLVEGELSGPPFEGSIPVSTYRNQKIDLVPVGAAKRGFNKKILRKD